jgi:SAM-dependent methyltransferase
VAAFRPTERFSNRVENYAKYRPGYPLEVVALMRDEMGLTPDSVIADVGSGTGILSKLFLENGNTVYGVEPNREMREAGERFLREFPNFRSVAGTAEETTLPDASVDFVTAGQAFHWFDVPRARREFQRILRGRGWVVLVWNYREEHHTPFLRAYEDLLVEFGTDYKQVSVGYAHKESLGTLLPGGYEFRKFLNRQLLDFGSLRGRLLSASYVPLEGDPRHAAMLARLRQIFDEHNTGGKVSVEYDTQVFYGRL